MSSSNFSIYDYIDFVQQIEHFKKNDEKTKNTVLNIENKKMRINIPNARIKKFHYRSEQDFGEYNATTKRTTNTKSKQYRQSKNTKKTYRQTFETEQKSNESDNETNESDSIEEITI